MTAIGKELQELLDQCDAAPAKLAAFEAALRTAMRELNDLVALASTLQKEAADTEFEAVRPDLKAFIDGSLLNRLGFVHLRAPQALQTLRQLGDGLRQLKSDCATLRQKADAPPPSATRA